MNPANPNAIPRACVIGWPIRHSRSPLIHRCWLKKHGLPGDYVLREVEPEGLAGFISTMAQEGFVGCNVTVPHKEAVMPLLDRLDATAASIGAVNTIWREGTDWIGGNTDMIGLLANLDAEAPGWDACEIRAVVLGAGGAARAAVAGLVLRKAATVTIVNRSLDRAQRLAAAFAGRGTDIRISSAGQAAAALGEATLLLNATSLGMQSKEPLELDLAPLPAGAVVYDLVYVPLETDLLSQARARGLVCVDGLGMLLHQAVPGFAHWFGVTPQVDAALRAHVLASF